RVTAVPTSGTEELGDPGERPLRMGPASPAQAIRRAGQNAGYGLQVWPYLHVCLYKDLGGRRYRILEGEVWYRWAYNGLRTTWGNPCRFKSCLAHQQKRRPVAESPGASNSQERNNSKAISAENFKSSFRLGGGLGPCTRSRANPSDFRNTRGRRSQGLQNPNSAAAPRMKPKLRSVNFLPA